jgi:hypothetical protein
MFVNKAVETMTGRTADLIIGLPFYDIFAQEGQLAPTIPECPTLLDRFQDEIVRVARQQQHNSTTQSDFLFCKINVGPCMDQGNKSLQHNFVIVSLEPIDTDSPAIVYLPMPQGCMGRKK